MKTIISPGDSGNIIVTIAIGDKYLNDWTNYACPSWIKYCEKYKLGLVVVEEDLIDLSSEKWKKATWQKLLIGKTLQQTNLKIKNVCYLDSDILISPLAPNIFNFHKEGKIGLVSIRKNMPYEFQEMRRRLAFLRNKFYSSDYPLDSSLFISIEDLYRLHNLPIYDDEACMGLIVFSCEEHAELMEKIFLKYDKTTKSITNGGDQTHLNYEFHNYGNIYKLNYRFQAIWAFEMAWFYPFLYESKYKNDSKIINSCIESSLYKNYFLHFAGLWHESSMWKRNSIFRENAELMEEYKEYLKKPVYGKPMGIKRPR